MTQEILILDRKSGRLVSADFHDNITSDQLMEAEVQAIELGQVAEPKPRVLFNIAKALDIPVGGLMELAGLRQSRNEALSEAAVRFAAKAEPTAELSAQEREALEEFVRVLAERSDRG